MLLGRKLPEARFLALTSSAPNAEGILDSFLSTCERVVVASRNAALDRKQADLLKHIAALCSGKPVVQVAMRGPYDANIAPLIGTVVLSYGDQPESVAAIVDVLLGEAMPTGNLPVRLTSAEPVAAL
jgi:beta-N-acetylhexosaminidase